MDPAHRAAGILRFLAHSTCNVATGAVKPYLLCTSPLNTYLNALFARFPKGGQSQLNHRCHDEELASQGDGSHSRPFAEIAQNSEVFTALLQRLEQCVAHNWEPLFEGQLDKGLPWTLTQIDAPTLLSQPLQAQALKV